MTCRPPHVCILVTYPEKHQFPQRCGAGLAHLRICHIRSEDTSSHRLHIKQLLALGVGLHWSVCEWCGVIYVASTIVTFYVTILCSATVSSRSIPAIGNVEHSGNRLKIAIQNVAINCFNCHHFRPRLSFNKKLGASVACTPLGKGPHLCTYMHKLFDGGHHCKAGFR